MTIAQKRFRSIFLVRLTVPSGAELERGLSMNLIRIAPNAKDHRPGASELQFETEAPSPGSVHPLVRLVSLISRLGLESVGSNPQTLRAKLLPDCDPLNTETQAKSYPLGKS